MSLVDRISSEKGLRGGEIGRHNQLKISRFKKTILTDNKQC